MSTISKLSLLAFFLFITIVNVIGQSNPKYKFTKKKYEVFEPSVSRDSSFLISIDNRARLQGAVVDTIKIETPTGDAGTRDYEIPNLSSLSLLVHSGSQNIISFYFNVKADTLDEPDEDLILVLKYNGKTANGADTIFTDTTTVLIKSKIKISKKESKAEKDLAEFQIKYYQSTFILRDTVYDVFIRDTADSFIMKICKTTINGIANEICRSDNLNANIEETEFLFRFKRLVRIVGTVDTSREGGLSEADKIAARKYLEWKNFIDLKKQKTLTAKENISDIKKFNDYIDTLDNKLNRLLQKTADTGYANVSAVLKNIAIYKRNFEQDKGQNNNKIDPIEKTWDFKEQIDTKETISFDSLSLRIEDGFIISIVLKPNKNDADKYSLNENTIIRKYYDLRSTTDATEVLNMYLPLEATKSYVKIQERKDSNGKIIKKWPKGYSQNKSQDKPSYYYYSTYYVRLGDILKYTPSIDSLGDVLLNLRNRNLTFSAHDPNKTIKLRDKDFNSFSQLNIFSDLIGLSEDKPNGLIQVEGKFETGIFSQPIANKNYFRKGKFKLLPSAYIAFIISKVENKLRHYPMSKDSVVLYNEIQKKYDDTTNYRRNISNINLIQFSSLMLNARFNLISFETDFASIKCYMEGSIVRTPINDTTNGKDNLGNPIIKDAKSVENSVRTSWGLIFKLKSTSRLGVDFGIDWQRIRSNSNKFTQIFTAYNSLKRLEELKESVYKKFLHFKPQIVVSHLNIYYYLDKDHQNRIYLRGRYFKELKSRSDNFLSAQLGYSTDLRGFFGLFKKSE